jgi:hypothetical protein
MVLSTYNKKSHLIEGFGYIYTTILVSGSKNVKKHYCKKKKIWRGYNRHLAVTTFFPSSLTFSMEYSDDSAMDSHISI